jgi:hypothetical protein
MVQSGLSAVDVGAVKRCKAEGSSIIIGISMKNYTSTEYAEALRRLDLEPYQQRLLQIHFHAPEQQHSGVVPNAFARSKSRR